MKFLDIKIDEKMFKILIIIAISFIIVYMALAMSSLLIFKTFKLSEYTSLDSEEIITHIDVLEYEGKKIEISGYAYKDGEKIETVNSSFIIKHKESGKMYRMRTQMEKNKNVEDIGQEYSGIHAQCLKLGIPKGEYDILVLYRNNDEDILADTLISFEI